ncbi:MAG: (2Fe-2S)-binding protein [Candidatus Sericytochromatia bacterium]|nr:(2Fe-2S)-binding protein [Candidatus Tanganyikabacteria bacterium]
MIDMFLNGLPVSVEPGTTVLEAARFFGIPIPTLCELEGLSPYGACRLCVVEIGEGPGAKMVSACTYPAQPGLRVRTASARIVRARKMVIELHLATCPQSKVLQDLAAAHGVREVRFKQEYEDCILCGLCVRICKEQMMAGAIGFQNRGGRRVIDTPFNIASDVCRHCGACMYVCPACQLRCTFDQPEKAVCGGCANLEPACLAKPAYDDMMCFMDPCVACETPTSNGRTT